MCGVLIERCLFNVSANKYVIVGSQVLYYLQTLNEYARWYVAFV